ncbi:MAG TPA: proton-conducting transporter membrane subunit, partial [Thermoplasmataceae archaeon]|nr:proton-conducting transporter membrane subunit [Thermoplasmataceae archaeon]
AGGLSLMGGYGLFGILIQIAPVLSSGFLWLLISLGIASMVYFSLSAMMQRSLKRMMAYASAGAMGFVTLSFGAGLLSTSYNRTLELSGGMFQVIAHGLIMSLVFAALYFIRINTGRESIPTLGGIFREAPVVSTFLLAGLMASLGLPGMAGFIGEFSVLIGSFQIIGWLILIVIFAMIITASYHIWAAQRSLYGPYNETIGPIKDVGVSQLAVLSWLLVTIIILGVLPNLFFGILTPYVGGI